jgi:hypothetical protein
MWPDETKTGRIFFPINDKFRPKNEFLNQRLLIISNTHAGPRLAEKMWKCKAQQQLAAADSLAHFLMLAQIL